MKTTIEIDCTPEEARRFMGLPDVEKVNTAYIDAVSSAMKGVSSTEQLENYARHLAPMGQFGLKLFQDFMDGAVRQGLQGSTPARNDDSGKPGE